MLPKTKKPKQVEMEKLTALIYGDPKIGKSTFCSNIPNALFLATETGLNYLEVFQTPINNWDDVLNTFGELAKGDHQFKTIIIDTVDNLYKMCAEYVCKKRSIEHESDLDHGKGWAMVSGEFERVLIKLSLLPYGFIMVSHATDKEVKTKTGAVLKAFPTLPPRARKFVLGMVDLILYFDLEEIAGKQGEKPIEKRVIRTKPCREYEAGDRQGILPDTLPMDYGVFVKALNGKTVKEEK